MAISLEKIQKLREQTLASINEVKRALDEAEGDEEQAVLILRKRGKIIADKKSSRETKAGIVASYSHANGRIGVLLELRCETDFVAKNTEFQSLAHDLALHIAAMSPTYLKSEDIPADVVESEKRVYEAQGDIANKPPQVQQTIIDGKLKKYYSEQCLLEQYFVKDDSKTVKELISEYITKVGENIEVGKFSRFEI